MTQWYISIDGQQYGPIDDEQLHQWVEQEKVHRHDLLWSEGMDAWQPAETVPGLFVAAPGAPPPLSPVPPAVTQDERRGVSAGRPHRGGVILAFGILGMLLCVVFGIIAWVMGNHDLQAMREGRMDPSGRSLTEAGRVIGIISVALRVAALIFFILFSSLVGRHMAWRMR